MKIGYIADDLTGSNATAVLLKKLGLETATVMTGAAIPNRNQLNAVGMDLDCRYLPNKRVEERVNAAITELYNWGIELVANRIDSTLRGRIGLITDLLLNSLGENSVAVLTPAFPNSGRVVVGGYLLVNGQLLENTAIKNDPMNPITESFVPTIIQEQSSHSISHIGIQHVNKGEAHLVKVMEKQILDGHRILVLDAITNQDIKVIASSMKQLKVPVFPVDPGPLTYEYVRSMLSSTSKKLRYLLSIGSVSDLTKKQLSYLVEKEKAAYIYLNPMNLLTSSMRHSEIETAISKFTNNNEENFFIITTCHPNKENISLQKIAMQQNESEDKLAKSLTSAIAEVTTRCILENKQNIGGVISCGGDVTASLCEFSGAQAIQLNDEIESLIAYGELLDGTLKYLPIITKGGLIGDETTLHKCLNYLQTKMNKGVFINE
ncbi:four-carbon acid sugar kinase family protein [Ureibacillus composti]|nr:four-carbon acid sugar kinase family protein [Ureibacillus composti]